MRNVPWLLGLIMVIGCNNRVYPETGMREEAILCSPCVQDWDCAIYDPCVFDGYTACRDGYCHILHTEDIAVACLLDVGGCEPHSVPSPDPTPTPTPTPTPSGMCSVGLHTPSSVFNQGDGERHCQYENPPDGRTYATGWANVICDVGPCTLEIVSATLYVHDAGGHVIRVASGINWSSQYRNFFSADDWHVQADPIRTNVWNVPLLANDRILHLGINATSIAGYNDAFVVMEFRTTGDAQAQVGIDYRWNLSDIVPRQGAISEWASCNNGGTISIASRRVDMDCANSLTSTTSSSISTPTPSSSDSSFVITLPPAGTAGCGSPITATAWVASSSYNSVGSTLTFPTPGGGGVWWNVYCGREPWGSRWGGTYRNVGLAGVSVSVNGENRSGSTLVCQNAHGSDPFWHMPISFFDDRVGTCP